MVEYRAADLPASSVVATDITVWMAARDADERGPRWDGLLGSECGDGEIDRLLAAGTGRVLRGRHRRGGLRWDRSTG